ncbi:MAG: endonuclease/exonuclease/phosphatase family protein [Planctomycetota bacterium]
MLRTTPWLKLFFGIKQSLLNRRRLKRVSAVALIALSSLTFFPGLPWWLELTTHFRPQIFIVSLAGVLLLLWQRERVLAIALASTVTAQALSLSFLFADTLTVAPEECDLTILSANVHLTNQDMESLVAMIEEQKPDVFSLIEINAKWVQALSHLKAEYPYQMTFADQGYFGILIWSRVPMDFEERDFAETGHPSILATTRTEKPLLLIATHPMPPMRKHFVAKRDAQLHAIADYLTAKTGPAVLLGDLNTTPWSHIFKQTCKTASLRSALHGWKPTWPTFFPPLGVPIDHVLVTQEVGIVFCKPQSGIGSDHLPLLTRLRVKH